jgi:hypothetical protein
MKKRCQVSIELVLTMGFALLIVSVLIILLYEHTASTYIAVNNNQAGLIARKITDTADSVYFLGYPTSVTLKVFMPENIASVNITGRTIIFNEESGQEIVSVAKVNLTGSLTKSSGLKFIKISALEKQVNITDHVN